MLKEIKEFWAVRSVSENPGCQMNANFGINVEVSD